MPRFSDSWVVDKVMYTYISNNGSASCLCCGANGTSGTIGGGIGHQPFLFSDGSGFEGVVNAMSDLETQDEVDNEIQAANASPWPPELRDRIWCDRLALRFKMKRERKVYRAFFERVLADKYANHHHHHLSNGNAVDNEKNASLSSSSLGEINLQNTVPILHKFCTTELSPVQLHQIFQPLSPSDLVEMIKTKYKIGPAFAVVLSSVEDQVANFKITGYRTDAAAHSNSSSPGRFSTSEEEDCNINNYEEEFEKQISFTKGFYLNIATRVDHQHHHHQQPSPHDNALEQWTVHDKVLLMFLRHMTSLASQSALLSRTVSGNNGHLDNSDEKKDVVRNNRKNPVPSFRSDRRVIRLLIARYWADRLIEKYDEVQNEKKYSIYY
ncbi:hypothetical protein ACHAWU_009107 [Discostella pseudostelligera]|uniref:Uncharacterized protein n=1 Tax=Discostella pseudostelligera TaxID=259834 RepID=A0ABD3LX70_9STRA